MQSGETAALLAYSSGKPDAARAAEWEQHVESCSACREFVAGQQAVWQALEGWEAPPATDDFDQRLYRRMELERVRPQPWWARVWRPSGSRLVRRGLPIAAAAGVLIVAGLMLERPPATRAPQPRSPQVDVLQPEQVEHAFDDMQMLGDFTRATRSDAAEL
ncbi:MAG: hypothetical protein LAP40_21830 [Acidobacteriia bacterium]|nr:hypothetical protein [Terriglobia bacterium]